MKYTGRTGYSVATIALGFLAWMAFTGDLSRQDLALGIVGVLVCGSASLLTWRAMGLSIAFDLRDVLELWRLPGNAMLDAGAITWALALDLLHCAPAGSYFRAFRFGEERGGRGRLRQVLAVAYTSVTPNSIVLGIDEEQKLLLVHQIVRSEISEVARRLGARP